MNTPLLDGIPKVSGRSLFKDFTAGVDPTGTATFRYGMSDVNDSQGKNRLRKGLGIAGGLLAGALLVPSALYGIIKGGKGLFRGGKGLLGRLSAGAKGFGRGLKKPYADIYHGFRGRNYLKNIKAGRAISPGGEQSFRKLVQSRGGNFLMGPMANKPLTPQLKLLASRDPAQFNALMGETTNALGSTLAFMGLGGAINAGSALAQYNLGQRLGRQAGPTARQRMLTPVRT